MNGTVSFVPQKKEDYETYLDFFRTLLKDKPYVDPASLAKYKNNIIMVGINYDKETKKHTCIIE
ncbi:MAG: hypothetical protein ACLSGW_12105 [Clostridium sp.]